MIISIPTKLVIKQFIYPIVGLQYPLSTLSQETMRAYFSSFEPIHETILSTR